MITLRCVAEHRLWVTSESRKARLKDVAIIQERGVSDTLRVLGRA